MTLVRAWLALWAAVSGCHFDATAIVDGGPPGGDSNDDSSVGNCYGTGIGHVCLANKPHGNLFVSGVSLDTSSLCDEIVSSPQGSLCVVAHETISISGQMRVTGSRPLVVVTTGPLMIAGTLDASSSSSGIGPGASSVACTSGIDGSQEGGGAGGSFGGLGGRGGSGGSGSPGVAGPAVGVPSLRAGCSGGAGGGDTSSAGGVPGIGGGAVYLISQQQIAISGAINASGSGGGGGKLATGAGGGGGSGGLIGLDAPMIVVDGSVFANGGGGGQGAGGNQVGVRGDDPQLATERASGGTAAGGGGNGGAGGAMNLSANQGVNVGYGGGGGGGGVGFVVVHGTLSGGGPVSPQN